MEKQTIKYTNGNITIIPIKTGMGIYVKDKKVLELNLEDAQSLMIAFLDFANDMLPPPPEIKGRKLLKTGKHKKQ